MTFRIIGLVLVLFLVFLLFVILGFLHVSPFFFWAHGLSTPWPIWPMAKQAQSTLKLPDPMKAQLPCMAVSPTRMALFLLMFACTVAASLPHVRQPAPDPIHQRTNPMHQQSTMLSTSPIATCSHLFAQSRPTH